MVVLVLGNNRITYCDSTMLTTMVCNVVKVLNTLRAAERRGERCHALIYIVLRVVDFSTNRPQKANLSFLLR